jgi:hypothetical protein
MGRSTILDDLVRRRDKFKITDREFEAVVQELTERVKDIVHANAERKVEEVVTKLRPFVLAAPSATELKIHYEIQMLFGDIQQVVARLRRRK